MRQGDESRAGGLLCRCKHRARGESARKEARIRPWRKREQLAGGPGDDKTADPYEQCEGEIASALRPQNFEESGACLIANREYEQGEADRLCSGADPEPQLAERKRHQQGSCDRPKGESRHLDAAHEITEAEQQEQSDDRLALKESNERLVG